MSNSVYFLKQAEKDFFLLAKSSSKARSLLKEAVQNIQELKLNKLSGGKQSVKVLTGISKKTEVLLINRGFISVLFEYRCFPKSFPVRIVFIVSDTPRYILIIEILHHKNMDRSKFMKSLQKKLKDV